MARVPLCASASAVLLAATALLLAAPRLARGCLYLYGGRHDEPHWHYGYVGADWPHGITTCAGTAQSPINIPGHSAFSLVEAGAESRFDFGTLASDGTNIAVTNNGHTVVVTLPSTFRPVDATVAAIGPLATTKLADKFTAASTEVNHVALNPLQFHMHTKSEHTLDGASYALELHIVTSVTAPALPACGAGGCLAVVGVMFEVVDDDEAATPPVNPFIDLVFAHMPLFENTTTHLPANKELNFDDVLPADRSYVTYGGSLTAPPCTEGILWHVLTTPMKITRDQLQMFELAVGATQCEDALPAVRRHLLTAVPTPAAAETSAVHFEVPEFATDTVDGKQCRKLQGVNYRTIQERGSRHLQFWAAPGLCAPQLSMLRARSPQVMGKLLYEAGGATNITLEQYRSIAEVNLTQDGGCAGIKSGAGTLAARSAAGLALRTGAAAALLAWLLLA